MRSTLTSPFSSAYKRFPGVSCRYYDGQTSKANRVTILIKAGSCVIKGDGVSREIPLSELTVSEPFAGTARMIKFKTGGFCELDETADIAPLLSQIGYREPLVARIQGRWERIALSFVLLLGLVAAGYRWGLPLAAKIVADRIPRPVLTYISAKSLEALDGKWLFPSKLSGKKKRGLINTFKKIKLPGENRPQIRVEFRSSELLGANAFALPDGTILFLDRLVKIAGTRNELIAIYAHEAGHVSHRHSIRQIIQNSAVAALMAAYIGDVSAMVGAVSGWILESKYSRDFERTADRYAATVLEMNGISPLALGKALERIEADHNSLREKQQGQTFTDYISTHPSTEERIRELKAFTRAGLRRI